MKYTIDAAVMERVKKFLQEAKDFARIRMDEGKKIDYVCANEAGHLRSCLDAAISLLDSAQGQEAEGWRDISSAPRDGTFITGIWWSGNITHGFPFVCQWDGEKWTTPDSTGCTVREPSHWLPILPPPKTADSKEAK